MQSLAAKQLAAAGVTLHPGETVKVVITAAGDRVKEWRSRPLALMESGLEYDVKKYQELLSGLYELKVNARAGKVSRQLQLMD